MSSIQQELIEFDFTTALEDALGLNAQARNSLFELFEEAMKADLNPEQASVSLIKSLDEALLSQAYQNKYGDFEDRQLCAVPCLLGKISPSAVKGSYAFAQRRGAVEPGAQCSTRCA